MSLETQSRPVWFGKAPSLNIDIHVEAMIVRRPAVTTDTSQLLEVNMSNENSEINEW